MNENEEYFVCCNKGSFHKCNDEPTALQNAKNLIRHHGKFSGGVRILKTVHIEGQGELSLNNVYSELFKQEN